MKKPTPNDDTAVNIALLSPGFETDGRPNELPAPTLTLSKLREALSDYWNQYDTATLKGIFAASVTGSSLGLYIKLTEDSAAVVRASSLIVNSFVNFLSALDTWAYIAGVMVGPPSIRKHVELAFATTCALIVGLGAAFISLGSATEDQTVTEKYVFAIINAYANMALGMMAMKGMKDPLVKAFVAVCATCGSKVFKQQQRMIKVAQEWKTAIAHIPLDKFDRKFGGKSADEMKLLLKNPDDLCSYLTSLHMHAERANADTNKRWAAKSKASRHGTIEKGLAFLLEVIGKVGLNGFTLLGFATFPVMATLSQTGYAQSALTATELEIGVSPNAAFGLTLADQFFNLFLGFLAGINIVLFLRSTMQAYATYSTSSAEAGGKLGHGLILMAFILSVVAGWDSGVPAEISWDRNCGNSTGMFNQSSSDLSFAPMAEWVEALPLHPKPGTVINMGAQTFNTYYMAFTLAKILFIIFATRIFTPAHIAIKATIDGIGTFIEQIREFSAMHLSGVLANAAKIADRRGEFGDADAKAMAKAMRERGIFASEHTPEGMALTDLTTHETATEDTPLINSYSV